MKYEDIALAAEMIEKQGKSREDVAKHRNLPSNVPAVGGWNKRKQMQKL